MPARLMQAPGSMAMKFGALLLVLVLSLAQPASGRRKLLVFLLDGFRSDYISDEALESLPGFKEIVSRGVKVDYLTPDFPSLSYPNYYTLMTGEYRVLFWGWGGLESNRNSLLLALESCLSVQFSLILWDTRDRQGVCVLG